MNESIKPLNFVYFSFSNRIGIKIYKTNVVRRWFLVLQIKNVFFSSSFFPIFVRTATWTAKATQVNANEKLSPSFCSLNENCCESKKEEESEIFLSSACLLVEMVWLSVCAAALVRAPVLIIFISIRHSAMAISRSVLMLGDGAVKVGNQRYLHNATDNRANRQQ